VIVMQRTPRSGTALVSLAALLMCSASHLSAQQRSIIRANLAARTLESVPPFDQHFALAVKWPANTQRIIMKYCRGDSPCQSTLAELQQPAENGVRGDDAVFLIPPLRPNQKYTFEFTLIPLKAQARVQTTVTSQTNHVERTARSGHAPETTHLRTVKTDSILPGPQDDSTPVMVSLVAEAHADLRRHFDTDFGVIWSPRPGPAYMGAGSNVHFYLTPINKDETRLDRRRNLRDQVLKRVSLFAGLSFVTLRTSESVENRYELGNPVWGVGIRPRFGGNAKRLDFFRVNAGMVYFKQRHANPLVEELANAQAPFVSVTGDIDLRSVLTPLAGLLGIR
jgi:hypothetical protein